MKIETQKQFENLLKICRANGVRSFKLDGIEVQLELEPAHEPERTLAVNELTPGALADMSHEEVLFYSSPAMNEDA